MAERPRQLSTTGDRWKAVSISDVVLILIIEIFVCDLGGFIRLMQYEDGRRTMLHGTVLWHGLLNASRMRNMRNIGHIAQNIIT